MPTKKIYFASDFHLGVPDYESSLEREKIIIRWLDHIKQDAEALYLLGDVFDFWFEYKHVVPRGHVRLLGKLAELSDAGIEIHFFTGNHDIWIDDYLPKEINLILHREPVIKDLHGKKFYLAHGDGLGPSDWKFKFMKMHFTSPLLQWMFSRIHPNFAVRLARYFSRRSRMVNLEKDEVYYGEKEWLIVHSKKILEKQAIDYFIFGHRHIAMTFDLSETSKYFNIGEWVFKRSYAVYDGMELKLEYFS